MIFKSNMRFLPQFIKKIHAEKLYTPHKFIHRWENIELGAYPPNYSE